MTIGLPRALLYYRYQELWRSFFEELGCEVVESGESSRGLLLEGNQCAIDESCLPIKLYLGHLRSLAGRCDYIFAPRLKCLGKNEELCVYFHGLYDLSRSVCGAERLISFNLDAGRTERACFMEMGMSLIRSPVRVFRAYRTAKRRQASRDAARRAAQRAASELPGLKILIAGQPYVSHDPYLGGPLVRMLKEQGGVPLFSDRCHRQSCARRSAEISPGLYWTLNKETVGAIAAHRAQADGVLLLSAFPCGPDSLVNELVARRVRDIPILRLTLDEMQGEAGMQTRIESFMDILAERSRRRVR